MAKSTRTRKTTAKGVPPSSWLRDHGLTLVLLGLFAASLAGQAFMGWQADNEERITHHVATLTLPAYLGGGGFWGALFENWESEFLQMWVFVMLTAYLHQRGSPESKDPDKAAAQDRDPGRDRNNSDAPAAVRSGRLARTLYAHSLGAALLALFVISFVFHWLGSAANAADQAHAHGEKAPTLLGWLGDPGFWFESFQNWQSEFLSTAVLIVLAIYLRERGSPESKPVGAPNRQTG